MNDSPNGAPGGQVIGYIGWGASNEAVYQAIAARNSAGDAGARVFAIEGGGAPPAAVRHLSSVETLFAECTTIFVDTAPGTLLHLLPRIRLAISDRNVVVLVGAGVTIASVQNHLQERKLIRCLITPFLLPDQATMAYYATPYLRGEEIAAFRGLFAGLDHVLELHREEQFEVVRGLAGIAPAVYYTLVDAMADGALMMGLPRADALPFIAAILLGAARTMRHGGEHPAVLREKALEAEEGAAGLMELESAGLRGLMMRVVEQAIRTSGFPPRSSTE